MKLPLLSGRQVLSTLKRLGFVELSRKGSHVKMKHYDGRKIFRLLFIYNPKRHFNTKSNIPSHVVQPHLFQR
ncbi:MAG: type II toxin-antitoxin system HicA family toxin [Bacteroidales bacterium]|nr:type II toxin-antitoxin system HicA family toxin [Bacteroidales bacterium]